MDIHKLASLMMRDFTIIAKRHADLARDYRAIRESWKRTLDATVPIMLESDQGEDGKLGAPAPTAQGSWAFVDEDNVEVR